MDPIEIPLGIIINIASTILEHQAGRLEGTFVGRALKVAGLVPPDFHDRLESILKDAVSHFFDKYPSYRQQSIVDFLQDKLVSEQICEHILERKVLDSPILLEKLQYYVQSEPETQILVRSRQISEEKIIQDFLKSFQYVRNKHLDQGQIAIIDVIEITENRILDALKSNESNLKEFIQNLLTIDTTPPITQVFEVDEKTYIRLEALHELIDQAVETTIGGYIAIVGPPGCGKSTSITQYIKKYEIRQKQPVIRYYCFTSLTDPASHRRLTKTEFLDSIIQQLQLASRSISPEIAKDIQTIKHVGYYNSEEKRLDLILERLKTFLQKMSLHLEKLNQKLLFVVDGIDHVARSGIDENTKLLSMLPYPLPQQIVCIVGTQSVQYLPAPIQHNCRSNAIIEVPRFSELQTQKYISKFKAVYQLIDRHQLHKIVVLTQGVPLYLRYVVTHLQVLTSPSEVSEYLSNMPPYDESIETYYWNLWNNLNKATEERIEARICELLARSPFPIKKEQLAPLLKLDVDKLPASLSQVEFLLAHDEAGYRIFHESFRAFIENELDDLIKQELDSRLFNYLNVQEFGRDLWYRYGFRFALQVGDFTYLVNHANTDLIEKSIADGRSKYELISNLGLAADAARRLHNPQALAHVGALIAHTTHRFEYHLNIYDLFTCMIKVRLVEQAMELIAPEGILQETQVEIADSIVLLALEGYKNEAKKLATQYFDRIPREIDTIDLLRSVAKLLTVFAEFPANTLSSWIDSHKDHSGLGGQYSNTGCDLLKSVLDLIYKFKRFDLKRSLKRLLLSGDNQIFWQSKWYLYVAFLEAKRDANNALHHIYIASKYVIDKIDRSLLAGLSVELGAEWKFVEALVQDIVELPPTDNQAVSYFDGSKHFDIFRSYIRALIGSNKHDEIEVIKQHLKAHNTWMALYHSACIDLVINFHNPNLSVQEIFVPLERLYAHEKQENERIFEVFSVIKQDISQFIQILVDTYFKQHNNPEDLLPIISRLNDLEVLNTHYGIGLAVTDFTHEIQCLEAFYTHNNSHQYLKPLLLDLHSRIRNKTLETETRSRSLLNLAILSASFGYRQLARDILHEAQNAARGYGYRKDSTIRILINATKIVNKYDPENALVRFADIGDWIRWLPQVTDGSETKWFNHALFEAILDFDFDLALQTLLTYFNHIARWKFYDCLAQMLQHYKGNSFRLAYVLAELVSEWDDDGFRDKFDTRVHLLNQVVKFGTSDEQEWIINQLRQFIVAETDPRQRKNFVETFNKKATECGLTIITDYSYISVKENQRPHEPPIREDKKLVINGNEVELFQYIDNISNVTEFELLLGHLQQAELFGFSEKVEQKFQELLDIIQTEGDLDDLVDKYSKHHRIDSKEHDAIAHAYARVRSHDKSLHHFGEAFREFHSWGLFDKDVKYLRPLINDDVTRALNFVLEVAEAGIQNLPYAGFGIATLLIRTLDEFGDQYRNVILEIYDTFHKYVGSIFSDLPDIFEEKIYDWMRQPSWQQISFDELAVQIIISEWGDHILHRRLYFTHQIPDLVVNDPDLWLPRIVEKLQDNNYTLRTQAAIVLHAVGLRHLNLLSNYTSQILTALKSHHLEVSHHLLSILSQLADEANELIDHLNNFYPIVKQQEIYTPELMPSQEYRDKILGRASLTIKEMISDVCQGLGINEDTMHWKIEKLLPSLGYDEQTAEDEHRNRWDTYRQGVDGDFIYFETYASYHLYHSFAILIDELVRQKPFSPETLETLYKRVCLYDPHMPLKRVGAKPLNTFIPDFDIQRYRTEISTEISDWLDFADVPNDVTTYSTPDSWITVGHVFTVSREWLHESGQIFSCFIPKSFAEQIRSGAAIPELMQAVLVLAPQPPHYTITLPEAQTLLDISHFSGNLRSMTYIPLMAIHSNDWWYYFQTQTILGIAGNWIGEYDLNWGDELGLDMYIDNKKLVQHNYWRDGYFTGTYEHSAAGSGTELLIASTFLNELMLKHDLCVLKTHVLTRYVYSKGKIDKKAKKSYYTVMFPK